MKSFLQEIAEKLAQAKKPELITLVFPNRRAALYFRKYFSQLLTKPVFAPTLLTIEEFIASFSTLQVPDRLELIHRLYKTYYDVYTQKGEAPSPEPEPFDQFYFWGDMLLKDFDEVDKYLVNGELLFADLSRQKELDSRFDFLTPEQVEFLREFWGNIDEDSLNKRRFLQVWRKLPEVYKNFRSSLLQQGIAYEGMMHREVAERFMQGAWTFSGFENGMLWFAGFNALTGAEEKIISKAVEEVQAKIFWDLDAYYLNNKNQEAGEFFREYQQHAFLGNTFDDAPANFRNKKSIEVIGAAQPVGQAKIMSQLLSDELAKGMNPEETLLVLPDEKLLLPVLHGISSSVDKLNVTMGFPLSNTPMFNLMELLLELQIHCRDDRFNHKQVVAILGHPYVLAVDPKSGNEKRKQILKDNIIFVDGSSLREANMLYQKIFCETNEQNVLSYLRAITELVGSQESLEALDKEYATHFIRLFNRMEDVLGTQYSNLKAFLKLFRQLIKTQKIPFTGEPLRGLQVMGVLETRNLDFKNVFVLSLNEGSLPSGNSKGSYIPYNIRKAYALPTPEHQDAMYAYLFYRVLQRAEKIFLFYNSETDILGQGEMSRFLQQLLYESHLPVHQKILHNPVQPLAITPIVVQKDEAVMAGLCKLNEGNFLFKGISPSALNTYIECKLRFYFKSIAKLREPNEVEEDIDARIMGNFLHKVMELFYLRLYEQKKSRHVVKDDFLNVDKRVDGLIEDVFREQYKIRSSKEVVFEGQRLVVREVVKQFALKILAKDAAYAPFIMEGIEQKGWVYKIRIDADPGEVVIGGNIDRIDRKDNLVRIIDYKTGKDKLHFESIDSLFVAGEKRNKAAFQTFLYALLYRAHNSYSHEDRLMPGLINRLNVFEESPSIGFTMDETLVSDILPLLPEFELKLKQLLEEVFNPAIPFDQTEQIETCRNCPYKDICYR